MDQHFNGIQFVERLIEDKGPTCEKEEAEKLKTCFDLLKKYSYLVDDKANRCLEDPQTVDHSQTEHQLAHHLTERITRSALDRFRRVRRFSNPANITLDPIEEHPTPIPLPEAELCHQDFFNDFPGMLLDDS